MGLGLRRAPRLTAMVLVAWVLLPASATAAPTPTAAARTAEVTLPGGATLAPGTYEAVISAPGTRVLATITVPSGQPGAPARRHQAGAFLLGPLPTVALGLVGAGLVMATVRYRRRRRARSRPRRSHRSGTAVPLRDYWEAVRLVDTGKYEEALPRLTRLEAKLPDELHAEAGFYISFALYQLLYLDEAEHRLAALHREDPHHFEIAYLLAYLRVQRRDYDGAEPVLESIAPQGGLTGNRRKLYGVVEYHRASAALRDGDIDTAVTLFDRVARLGDFSDRVPSELRNRHVMLGARALLEKDVTVATSHFERLEEAADGLTGDRREDLLTSARLGLGLAAWLDRDYETADDRLVEAIRTLDPEAPLAAQWPSAGGMADTTLEALTEAGTEVRTPRNRLLRDMYFMRGIAALHRENDDTSNRTGPIAFPAEAVSRFACARALDPTFADVYLVVGMLFVHFGGPARRAQGIEALREARKRGAHDPDLIQILAREDAEGNQAGHYLDILDAYLDDPTVRASIRDELLKRRARFGKPRAWGDPAEAHRATRAEPTVTELSDRADLLVARVRLIAEAEAENGLQVTLYAAEELARASELLLAQVRMVERCEESVLALIGDTLLKDFRRR